MRKLICFISILTLFLGNMVYCADDFTFLDRDLVFGSDMENFQQTYTEFVSNPDISSPTETVMTYRINKGEKEISFNVTFINNLLSKFVMNSSVSDGSDEEMINSILKQFTYVPSKDFSEEEMGDVVEEYTKGNLRALAFIGGFYILTVEQMK